MFRIVMLFVMIIWLSGCVTAAKHQQRFPTAGKNDIQEVKSHTDVAKVPDAPADEIEAFRADLQKKVDDFNSKAYVLQGQLFSSQEQIKILCEIPASIPKNPSIDQYLDRYKDDPVSLPNIDCVFIKTNDGSDTMYSYAISPQRTWYTVNKRTWFFPKGMLSISKHPFHEASITESLDLNRMTFSPQDAYPVQPGKELVLTKTSPDRQEDESRVFVRKSFDITRGGKPVDRLHVLVRDYGVIPFFGEPTRIRRWYLYSERSNVLLRSSFYRGPQGTGGLDSTGLESIQFFQNGELLYEINKEEMAPVSGFLTRYNVWH